MTLPVTALYAGMLALVLMWLAFLVGSARGKAGVSIGDGGNSELLEQIRKHGNAVEYVPIAIILIGVIEANGGHPYFLHTLGTVLLISRILHPLGIKADKMGHPLRALGALGTMLVILTGAVYAIWQYYTAMTALSSA